MSHYFPWNENDAFAACGHRMTATDTHSGQPTCPACAAHLDELERWLDEEQIPLDAEEAHYELDPVLNAGIPARQKTPFGADLFAFAVTLARRHR